MKERFLEFAKAEDGTEEIYLYGPIRKQSLLEKAWEMDEEGRTDAMTFAERLAAVESDSITVRINSNGGSVSEGLAIYNTLVSSEKEITTICDGFACSIASVIFCAGKNRIMQDASLLMIHNAWTEGGNGDANYFRKLAQDLDKVTLPSVKAYMSVSNLVEEDIKRLMDDETWIGADEAKEWGFATEICAQEAKQELQQTQLLNLVKKNNEMKKRIKELTKSQPQDAWKNFFN